MHTPHFELTNPWNGTPNDVGAYFNTPIRHVVCRFVAYHRRHRALPATPLRCGYGFTFCHVVFFCLNPDTPDGKDLGDIPAHHAHSPYHRRHRALPATPLRFGYGFTFCHVVVLCLNPDTPDGKDLGDVNIFSTLLA